MRGFDSANKIVGESVGVHGSAIADDPVLQRLSLCVDDLLPALSRVCRVYGDGAAMHAMIALTASMARKDGLEESIAEAFRVNAAMLDDRPLRHLPGPPLESGQILRLSNLGNWFRQRLHEFFAVGRLKRQTERMVTPRPVPPYHRNDGSKELFCASNAAEHGVRDAAAAQ